MMNLPKYLYKYRSFNPNHLEAIDNNKVWFSNGSELNDPFDCTREFPSVVASRDSLIRFGKSKLPALIKKKQIRSDIPAQVAIERWADYQLQYKTGFALESTNEFHSLIIECLERTFVCCFSTTYNNHLLWAHYANHHKGLCLRYNTEKLLASVGSIHHDWINYDDEPMNFLDMTMSVDQYEAVKDIIYTKSTGWEYEREYRINLNELRMSSNQNKSKPVVHSADALDCIFFGLKADENKKRSLVNSLEGRGVLFKDVYRKLSSYELFCKDVAFN